MSRDHVTSYFAEVDILNEDLEKKNKTGPLLITGRAILSMAQRGVRAYKKALSFTKMKWNIKENTPIESGTTKEDVVHFVLLSMYKLEKKNKDSEDDDVEESEVDMALEIGDGDGDNISLSAVVDEVVSPVDEAENAIDNEADFLDDDYMFPGFFAFMLYGPFVENEDKLDILRKGSALKKNVESRAEKRKRGVKQKDLDRENNTEGDRGLTIDQKINMDHNLILQAKLAMLHKVGLL